MASGKSLELAAILTRNREWVHKHEVEENHPSNRRERRALRGYGRWLTPSTTPYVKA